MALSGALEPGAWSNISCTLRVLSDPNKSEAPTTTPIQSVANDPSVIRGMERAIELARAVRGRTSVNPPVGAVVLRDGQIIGEGATHPPGGPHAEVIALEAAGHLARGSTLVVTLEPCNHSGRTPPCTEAIHRAGISRVVIGVRDTNPRVTGGGIAALKQLGVIPEVGLCAHASAELVAPSLHLVVSGRPFVTAKWAMTLDGKIAGSCGSERITSDASQEEAHDLRNQVDAVVVGAETARLDDPQLTVRPPPIDGRQPLRVVIDSSASLAGNARLLRGDGDAVVLTASASPAARARLERVGADVIQAPRQSDGRVDLLAALGLLGERGLAHVLVEGGARLLGSLFAADLVDEVIVFIAPRVMGPGVPALDLTGFARLVPTWDLQGPSIHRFGPDIMVRGRRAPLVIG